MLCSCFPMLSFLPPSMICVPTHTHMHELSNQSGHWSCFVSNPTGRSGALHLVVWIGLDFGGEGGFSLSVSLTKLEPQPPEPTSRCGKQQNQKKEQLHGRCGFRRFAGVPSREAPMPKATGTVATRMGEDGRLSKSSGLRKTIGFLWPSRGWGPKPMLRNSHNESAEKDRGRRIAGDRTHC